MSDQSKRKNRYIPGIDGLRAIAVLAVIAYHMKFDWASGGLLGVTIFFVLSGYLITNLLLVEWEVNHKINLKQFWIRRARRLLPAMFTMLFIVTAWVTLFDHSFLSKLREDFLAASLYVSNWWYIFQDLSYFELMGTPSLLTHFWSLAIEEQFYILWPVLVSIGLLFKISKKHALKMILLASLVSAIAMALIYDPNIDPSRVYYGTDTRVFSLLIGAALAIVWPGQKLARQIPPQIRIPLDIIGVLSLTIILFIIALTNQYGSFLYYGGMVLVSLLSALLIAVIVHPASKFGKLMSFKPLRWIGVRSYGIYLWHYPIILLTSPKIDTGEISIARTFFQLSLVLIISALSYRYIENPIRQGVIGNTIKTFRIKEWDASKITTSRWVIFGCTILVIFTSAVGLLSSPNNTSHTKKELADSPAVEKHKENAQTSITIDNPPKTKQQEDQPAIEQKSISVIGDSIMINAIPFLKEYFPNIVIDAQIGRQMSQAVEVVEALKHEGNLGDYLIIGLGSNGSFNSGQLHSLLDSLDKDKKVILITIRVSRPWETTVNTTLRTIAKQYENISLVDWYSASANHNEYFASDGVHLSKTGAKVFSSLLENEINK